MTLHFKSLYQKLEALDLIIQSALTQGRVDYVSASIRDRNRILSAIEDYISILIEDNDKSELSDLISLNRKACQRQNHIIKMVGQMKDVVRTDLARCSTSARESVYAKNPQKHHRFRV